MTALVTPAAHAGAEISCVAANLSCELVKGLPTALVALVIGCFATYIAYHQYRVAKAKLNLDLFDRRNKIFQVTWEFLSTGMQGQSPTLFNAAFTNVIPEASFLFGAEIETYMQDASRRMIDLFMINARSDARQGVMMPEDVTRHYDLSSWFLQEAQTGARKKFGAYLDFANWR